MGDGHPEDKENGPDSAANTPPSSFPVPHYFPPSEAFSRPGHWSAWRRNRSRWLLIPDAIEWGTEWLVFRLRRSAVFDLLQLTASLSIVFGVISWFLRRDEVRRDRLYRAWEIIAAAKTERINGARNEALSDLAKHQFSLAGISLPRGTWLGPIDLRGADLRGASMAKVSLAGAKLGCRGWGGSKRCTDFSGAHLRGSDLTGADLSGTDFSDADLSGSNLDGADLSGAELKHAQLVGSNLSGVCLERAHLMQTNLDSSNLLDVDLQDAYIEEVGLKGVYNYNAIYSLKGARIVGPDGGEISSLDLLVEPQPDTSTYDNLHRAVMRAAGITVPPPCD